MMKPVVDFGKQVFALTHDVKQGKTDILEIREDLKAVRVDIAELRQELNETRLEFKDVLRIVERLAYEGQRERDSAAHERAQAETERRLLLSEIENRFLRHERSSLPPPPSKSNAPTV